MKLIRNSNWKLDPRKLRPVQAETDEPKNESWMMSTEDKTFLI